MADNYIERMEQEAEERRKAKAAKKQKDWARRLAAYKASLKEKSDNPSPQN